jgi:hypothetical protein
MTDHPDVPGQDRVPNPDAKEVNAEQYDPAMARPEDVATANPAYETDTPTRGGNPGAAPSNNPAGSAGPATSGPSVSVSSGTGG